MVTDMARDMAGVRGLIVPAASPPVKAANRALAAATGSMIGWLEASDRLAPTALFEAAAALADQPELRLIYTDEDSVAGDGTRTGAMFKSSWSPDLALAGDCFGQVALMSRSQALAAGGFDSEAAPFERYDLALRLTQNAAANEIRHLSKVLFHRGRLRGARPPPFPASRAIASQPALHALVTRHLARSASALQLRERQQGIAFWPTLAAPLPDPAPRVSVIIPTRDHAALLERCLTGLLHETDYPDLDILVVDNGSTDGQALALLARIQHDPRIRVMAQPGPFNWSALNNAAAAEATGDILLLLNNDVEVLEAGWLATMAAHALRPDVGVVGARLLVPDGRLQHGGVLLGGEAVHALTYAAAEEPGYLGQIALGRDVAAVTGACLAIRRAVFREMGGLDQERLHVAWSDVDLCLRVREAGYRVLWLPGAVLTHHERATRGRDVSLEQQARHELERAVMQRRWPAPMAQDPLLNPNLEGTATAIVLKLPPQHTKI
jgi:GT2 family glycosyltransferase